MSSIRQALTSTRSIRRWKALEVSSAFCDARPCIVVDAVGSYESSAQERLETMADLHGRVRGPLVPKVLALEEGALILDCPASVDLGSLWQASRAAGRKVLNYAQAAALGLDLAVALGQLKNAWNRGLGSLCWANLLADSDGGAWLLLIPGAEVGWHPDAAIHQAPEVVAGAVPTPAADVFAMWSLFLSYMDILELPPRMMHALANGATDEYSRLFVATQQAAGASIVSNRLASTAHAVPLWERLWEALGISPDHGEFRRRMVELMEDYRQEGRAAGVQRVGGGRYELRRSVGVGATGSVWEAVDHNLSETVAIKRLRSDVGDNTKRRFKREAQLLRKVIHPAVIHGFDYFEEDGAAFAVMRFVDGVQLDAYAGGLEPSAERIAEVIADVAAGLAALHAEGIIHRDVKPANVLVEGDGSAVLVDLGVASSGELSAFTTSAGSLRYMSPEQRHNGAVEASTDIYSLGVTWWATLHLARGLRPDWARFESSPLTEAIAEELGLAAAHLAFLRACLTVEPGARITADDLVRGLIQAPAEVRSDGRPTLGVGPSAKWLDLPHGQVVSLSRRTVMRRIVQALVDARLTSAGPVDAASLLAAGWPGERMTEDSGMNRLYVTMSRMRKLGLETVLTTTDDGWALNKDLRIIQASETARA